MVTEARNATTLEAAGQWANESNFTGAHSGNCMTEDTDAEVSGEFSFNFSVIPDGATIDGIEVLLHCIAGDTDDDLTVELYDSVSTWRAKTVADPGSGAACGDCVDKTVGGSADTWGGTWTGTHIKSSSFRIRVTAAKAAKSGGYWACDYCLVTVHYTAVTSYTKDFTTDAVLKAVQTKTLLTDALLKFVQTKTFNADALLKFVQTKTFDVDALLKGVYEKTFDVDAILLKAQTIDFTVDALLTAPQVKNFTTDAILKLSPKKTFDVDAILTQALTKTFTTDAILALVQTKTFTIDAILFLKPVKTFTVDALLKAIQMKTFVVDAILLQSVEKTFLVDAILTKSFTKTFDTDAILVKSQTKSFTCDAILEGEVPPPPVVEDRPPIITPSISVSVSAK